MRTTSRVWSCSAVQRVKPELDRVVRRTNNGDGSATGYLAAGRALVARSVKRWRSVVVDGLGAELNRHELSARFGEALLGLVGGG